MSSACSFGLVIVVALTALPLQISLATSEWNQEGRDLILKIHNDRRREEGGCQVNKLEYDQGLEAQAKQWAERCIVEHSKEDRGENLAWDAKNLKEDESIVAAAQRWFDEKNSYSYGQHDCGPSMACHYTQMVWASTNKIGCYSTKCNYLTGAGANFWYIVCIYTPKGNYKGVKIYEKSCPTPCLKGQTEDDGLCVGEPEKTEEELKCKDDNDNCGLWASNGQCKTNPSYMEKQCKKSCKICQSDEVEECKDLQVACAEWAGFGQCKANPEAMRYNCKKTCGEC